MTLKLGEGAKKKEVCNNEKTRMDTFHYTNFVRVGRPTSSRFYNYSDY